MAPVARARPVAGGASAGQHRFRTRSALEVVHALAAALGWPRSQLSALVGGSPATPVRGVLLGSGAAPDGTSIDLVLAWGETGIAGGVPCLEAGAILAGGAGGLDERLADAVGLRAGSLHPVRSVPRDWTKLVGYVPPDALEHVREAVFAAGAGCVGDYDRCSWSVHGTGTFRGGEGTNPAVGTRGEFEQVEEARFETVLPDHLRDRVWRAYAAAHPYEEPAVDFVALQTPAPVGAGRIGVLPGGDLDGCIERLERLVGNVDVTPAASAALVGAVAEPDHVAVMNGPVGDLLEELLAEATLGLVVTGAASPEERALLAGRGCAVAVVDERRLHAALAPALAAHLSRRLELAVHPSGAAPDMASAPAQRPSIAQPGAATPAAPAGASTAAPTGTYRLQFDGGSRGNPGPAAYGWVLYGPSGDEFDAAGVRCGRTTNNVAEWTGLLRGLERALELGVKELQVRGDSELVIKQMTGVYRVKNAQLKPLADQVAALLPRFQRVDVKHLYRTDNARADALANEALDGKR